MLALTSAVSGLTGAAFLPKSAGLIATALARQLPRIHQATGWHAACPSLTQPTRGALALAHEGSSVADGPRQALVAPKLDFNNYQAVFEGRPFHELLRAYVVLQACTVSPLVRNADALVSTSRRFLGDKITFGLVRGTFFKQFCAGEAEADIWPTMNMLRAHGIRAIIDYAAEDDVDAGATSSSQADVPAAATTDGAAATGFNAQQLVVGRVYDYASEAQCDHHVNIFLKAIDTVGKIEGHGFAAIKMTALGNPQLLERMSDALVEIRDWFRAGDTDGDGFVTREEFSRLYRQVFPDASAELIRRAFSTLDLEGRGQVDIISWTHRIRLQDMPRMVELIRRHGAKGGLADEMVAVALTEEEVALADAMMGRMEKLAAAAAAQGVRLMVDAEHTYFQPAIDHTVKALSLKYNRGSNGPVIFNTYQAYLKASHELMLEDMERARREGYIFAAKLVRGAYMQLERRRAAAQGEPSPIWDTLDDTHKNYDTCLDAVLDEVASHGAHLMVASHNQKSIEHTVSGLAARNLSPAASGVYFGQLLGMADNLTFTLGQHGYEAFKYVPYGPIELVLPYLVRRAQENSAIMGAGVKRQIKMLRQELVRRVVSWK